MNRCAYCEGQCSCHINPPCDFHEHHQECEICGKLVCDDLAEQIRNPDDGGWIWVCPACAEESNGD